jgi:hypothetical protein
MLLISQRSSEQDAKYVKKAWSSLAGLKRAYPITLQFDKDGSHVDSAQLVLIFLSNDFLEEYDLFLDAIVAGPRMIPIMCRATSLSGTPFTKFEVLPNANYPKKCLDDYPNLDEAFYPIAKEIHTIIEKNFAREVRV